METKRKNRALDLKVPMAVKLWAVSVDRENPYDKKKTFQKLALLNDLAKDSLDNPGDNIIHLPFHYEETENYLRMRIKTNTGINARIYIPKSLEIMPDRVTLKRV